MRVILDLLAKGNAQSSRDLSVRNHLDTCVPQCVNLVDELILHVSGQHCPAPLSYK